jgi:hypothetical protein
MQILSMRDQLVTSRLNKYSGIVDTAASLAGG